ncbi:uncharacterized protein [Syngnathus scovelli]|uniref:uncharacterized protein n=1 Tax=Syngnathus scovelli TaxID=161590 RepID=UPI0021103A72|nr:uncharacterized protein LOC125970138 [Syngnathus scovelli]
MSFAYRMTERDIRKMIELRAANSAIFTGQRHSAMRGWRAIRQELGLEGMVSARQLKKKWDNLKEKYRILKNPPAGMERSGRPLWRWFQLMDQASTGRLATSAKRLEPSALDDDDNNVPRFTFDDLAQHTAQLGSDEEAEACDEDVDTAVQNLLSVDVPEVNGDTKMDVQQAAGQHLRPHDIALLHEGLARGGHEVEVEAEVEVPSCGSPADHELLRDRQDWDRAALERDRVVLDRDRAALERDRAALERDRAALERDRVCLDRDRALLDRDRAFLERDRALAERAREEAARARSLLTDGKGMLESERAAREDNELSGKQGIVPTSFYQNLMAIEVRPEQLESTRRLVSLFSKLVDKL